MQIFIVKKESGFRSQETDFGGIRNPESENPEFRRPNLEPQSGRGVPPLVRG